MIITMPAAVPELVDQTNRGYLPWSKMTESGQYSIEDVIQNYYLHLIRVAKDVIHPAIQSKLAPSDLVQESILAAFAKPEKIYGKSSQQLRAFLISVLLNKYKQHRRDINRHGEVHLYQLNQPSGSNSGSNHDDYEDRRSPQPMNSAERDEMAAIVIQCVKRLPTKLAAIMQMRLQEGLNVVQIAARLNIEKSAAQKRYERAILRLKKMPEIQKLKRFFE